MRVTAALALGLLAVALTAVPAEPPTAVALEHVRKACEAVWADGASYQVQRCTERAMAALGQDDQLRNQELKEMLISSTNDLEVCETELGKLRSELSGTKISRKSPEPQRHK